MVKEKIAIIGSGHLATALLEGLTGVGKVQGQDIIVSNPSGRGLLALAEKFKVRTSRSNRKAVLSSAWIILAVRPGVVQKIIEEIRGEIKDKIVISTAAGLDLGLLLKWCQNKRQKIVRVMPNLPVSVDQGVVGFAANKNVIVAEREKLLNFLEKLGIVVNLQNEGAMDALTILAACGPAIVSRLVELLARYGTIEGLNKRTSEKIVLQTFKGTASYLEKKKLTARKLEELVATPGGVTEKILQSFVEGRMQEDLFKSLDSGLVKLNKLAQKFKQERTVKKYGHD